MIEKDEKKVGRSKNLEFEEMYIMYLKNLFAMHVEYLKKAEESQDFERVNKIKGTISGIEMAVDAFNFIYELQKSKSGTTEPDLPSYEGGKIIVVKTKN